MYDTQVEATEKRIEYLLNDRSLKYKGIGNIGWGEYKVRIINKFKSRNIPLTLIDWIKVDNYFLNGGDPDSVAMDMIRMEVGLKDEHVSAKYIANLRKKER